MTDTPFSHIVLLDDHAPGIKRVIAQLCGDHGRVVTAPQLPPPTIVALSGVYGRPMPNG